MKSSAVALLAPMVLIASIGPVKAQNYSWNGFYGGAHIGGMSVSGAGFSDVGIADIRGGAVEFTATQARAFTGKSGDVTTAMGGLQFGYNWRLNQTFVAGLEADISFVGDKSSTFSNAAHDTASLSRIVAHATITNANPLDYFGTVRGRFGYLIAEPLLVYVTGGLAYAKVDSAGNLTSFYTNSIVLPDAATFQGTAIRTGYVIGGGFEFAVSRNVSVKLEGLFYDLGTATATATLRSFNEGGLLLSSHTITKARDLDGAIARIGMNILF